MSVKESQCAAYVTGFNLDTVEIALSVVQGVVTVLSIVGSALLIFSHVILHPLRRSKSRVLIVHLAAASFLQAFPNFIAVFMDFRTRFRIDKGTSDITNNGTVCIETSQVLDHSAKVYCYLCVYQGFISLIGTLSTVFWTVCVCIHYFILVSCQNNKLASRLTYAYYVIAWLVPLGICLWLLFHNWLGFEPTYSTMNCGIRADCVPHHYPYHYSRNDTSYDAGNWNRAIGVLFGLKIWQLLAFLTIPCLFVAIRYKNRRRTRQNQHVPLLYLNQVKNMEKKILLVPAIYLLISAVCFASDMYFFINHKKNLEDLEYNNGGIIFMHFLIRIFDNLQGVIIFCIFLLIPKEVRDIIIQHVFRRPQPANRNRNTAIPELTNSSCRLTTDTTGSTQGYDAEQSCSQGD